MERLHREDQVLLKMLETGQKHKANEFKVSNQNEPLIALEKKGLITRPWNNSKKKDFKWNYIAENQKKKAREFLGVNSLSDEVKES